MTRSPDLVAVLFKLVDQSGVRALLAVDKQHSTEIGRIPVWALLLLVAIEGQSCFLPAPRKGRANEHANGGP
jgi:hypothetical protein